MALTARQRNNIIIIGSTVVLGLLTLLNKHMHNTPAETVPLFDEQAQLKQLQLDGVWMARAAAGPWQCDEQVLNCQQWVDSWLAIRVSPSLLMPETGIEEKPQELLLQLQDHEAQIWSIYPASGWLRSTAGHWYQIPPSQRQSLQPVFDAKP